MVSEADAEAELLESVTAEENPSDSLMVRLIGDLEESQIKKLDLRWKFDEFYSIYSVRPSGHACIDFFFFFLILYFFDFYSPRQLFWIFDFRWHGDLTFFSRTISSETQEGFPSACASSKERAHDG